MEGTCQVNCTLSEYSFTPKPQNPALYAPKLNVIVLMLDPFVIYSLYILV